MSDYEKVRELISANPAGLSMGVWAENLHGSALRRVIETAEEVLRLHRASCKMDLTDRDRCTLARRLKAAAGRVNSLLEMADDYNGRDGWLYGQRCSDLFDEMAKALDTKPQTLRDLI